jgi:alginate O-acetyltransferase complex protein AlgI
MPVGKPRTATMRPIAIRRRGRKALLTLSVVANLGILGIFKYYDFFAASAAGLLEQLGIPANPPLLRVILPVGISFYTFQTLSYTIDIYRGQLRACPSLLRFAAFVAFFPQLVAGPIVRARDFLPQLAQPRRITWAQTNEGAYLILWGLFKKVVIAGQSGPIGRWGVRRRSCDAGRRSGAGRGLRVCGADLL